MSAACSTHQVGEEEGGRPRLRVASALERRASPVITIRDPWESEGWRRTNRMLLLWWMECRRWIRHRGPSHHTQLITRHHTTAAFLFLSCLHSLVHLHGSPVLNLSCSGICCSGFFSLHLVSPVLLWSEQVWFFWTHTRRKTRLSLVSDRIITRTILSFQCIKPTRFVLLLPNSDMTWGVKFLSNEGRGDRCMFYQSCFYMCSHTHQHFYKTFPLTHSLQESKTNLYVGKVLQMPLYDFKFQFMVKKQNKTGVSLQC